MVKMYSNGITQYVHETDIDRFKRAGYVVVEDPKPAEPEPAPEPEKKPAKTAKKEE